MHFFRDNPNVPSDLEMMPQPAGLHRENGTLLSNNHTPLIAHTADDILTTLTGLYGDRQGMPISNDYQTYNPTVPPTPQRSFAYWTDPVDDTAPLARTPVTTPTRTWSTRRLRRPPRIPRSARPTTPAPWVPFTRAGCDVGARGHGQQELENAAVGHRRRVRRELARGAAAPADPDSYKDAETADYVGIAVHCAQRQRLLHLAPRR